MNEKFKNHPLNGVKLEDVLGELLRHYGWEILADQINLNCFKSHPSFASSIKFLRRTEWARERLEAFYLYRFKQYPLPDEEQHKFPPRNRIFDQAPLADSPAEIELGDGEFFDDPITGPVFPDKRTVQKTRRGKTKPDNGSSVDPWAKARSKK